MNPRNTAAGAMRNLDPALVRRRGLKAWTYQTVWPPSTPEPASHSEMLAAMAAWGLPVEPHWQRCDGIDAVWAFCEHWRDTRLDLEFETDGVVVKVDRLSQRRHLGWTSKFPRWATAFKFPAQQATTLLQRIAVNIGRTGAATPFAVLDPVFVGGSTVSLATLHNPDDLARKDIRERDTGDRRKGGRRHSARRRTRPREAAGRLDAVGDADGVPGLRQSRCTSPTTRPCGAARTARVRPSCSAASSTSPRAAR